MDSHRSCSRRPLPLSMDSGSRIMISIPRSGGSMAGVTRRCWRGRWRMKAGTRVERMLGRRCEYHLLQSFLEFVLMRCGVGTRRASSRSWRGARGCLRCRFDYTVLRVHKRTWNPIYIILLSSSQVCAFTPPSARIFSLMSQSFLPSALFFPSSESSPVAPKGTR